MAFVVYSEAISGEVVIKYKSMDILKELSVSRLLVFLETEPQSNKYRQVILTPEQFKKMSDVICEVVDKKGDEETVSINMSIGTYLLPDLNEFPK